MRKIDEAKMLFFEYKDCTKCPTLCTQRNQVIFGAGNVTSCDLMIINESPSAIDDGDSSGLPLVDAVNFRGEESPGKLLDNALTAAGITRDSVYVTNVVMCRPTLEDENKKKKGRKPYKEEIDNCRERLLKEIYIVDPKLIILMGKESAELATSSSVEKALGSIFELELTGRIEGSKLLYPAIVTWSPSYVLSTGISEPKTGTECKQFFESIESAARIIKVSKRIHEGA